MPSQPSLISDDPLDLFSARKFVMSFETLTDWFAQCDDSIVPREVTREVFDAASRAGKIITREHGHTTDICLIPPDPTWHDLHAITQALHSHRFTPDKLTAEMGEIQERYLFLRKVATYLTRLDVTFLNDDEKSILTTRILIGNATSMNETSQKGYDSQVSFWVSC